MDPPFQWRGELSLRGELIEDFCPFPDSVEWRVGQDFLRASGAKSFVSDASPVPFLINNDGDLSCRVAELLFASLSANSSTDGEFVMLELGIGVGLFARCFLDRFRWLCEIHQQAYYDHLCYILGDYSPKMLIDAARHGVLAEHRDRYRLRVVNALDPESALAGDLHGESCLRAVFLNYLLDCLPAAILEIGDGTVRQLCVRTHYRPERDAGSQNGTKARISKLLTSDSPEDRRELRALADSFVAEYEFRSCDWKDVPEPHCLEKQRTKPGIVVHSFGAIRCLERLIKLLQPSGFILMNDYGSAESERREDWFEHQRYSGATFVGVNFDELKRYFQGEAYRFVQPEDGNESLYSRMLGHAELSIQVVEKFIELFSKRNLEERGRLKELARGCLSHQHFEAALSAYRRILEDQPFDWISLGEVAELLGFGFGDPAAGLSAIREALSVNPSCSSHLWDIAGDCLLDCGQPHEAR